jgi:hypothetical protein
VQAFQGRGAPWAARTAAAAAAVRREALLPEATAEPKRLEKSKRGEPVPPGHSWPAGQAEQLPGSPKVPAPQPVQEAAPAARERGGWQLKGTQSEEDWGGAAEAGAVPGPHAKVREMHWPAVVAPVALVPVPLLQAVQEEALEAPRAPEKVLRGQGVQPGEPEEELLKVPASQGEHWEEPAAEKLPAPQGTQVDATVAPTAELALPAGQATQAPRVCPGAALCVPFGQGRQPAALVEPAALEPVPAGHREQRLEPGEAA